MKVEEIENMKGELDIDNSAYINSYNNGYGVHVQ